MCLVLYIYYLTSKYHSISMTPPYYINMGKKVQRDWNICFRSCAQQSQESISSILTPEPLLLTICKMSSNTASPLTDSNSVKGKDIKDNGVNGSGRGWK